MTAARGVMAVWHDLEPGHDAEFDAWYRRQHIPERLQQPGFLEARRYATAGDSPRYCAIYWLESVAALQTPQYLARLDQPTGWTRRMMPRFRDMARSPCTMSCDYGSGLGGMMIWIADFSADGAADSLRARLAPVLAAHCDDPGIVRVQLWETDPEVRARVSLEQRFRSGRDRVADWIVFIEGAAAEALVAAADRTRAAIGGAASAALRVSPWYRLLWRVEADEAPAPCADPENVGNEF